MASGGPFIPLLARASGGGARSGGRAKGRGPRGGGPRSSPTCSESPAGGARGAEETAAAAEKPILAGWRARALSGGEEGESCGVRPARPLPRPGPAQPASGREGKGRRAPSWACREHAPPVGGGTPGQRRKEARGAASQAQRAGRGGGALFFCCPSWEPPLVKDASFGCPLLNETPPPVC